METVVERIRRIGRESASPVEASPATQQAIASPPEQSITPSQPDEREQAIVDRHTSEAPNIGFLQRGARGIAQMEIETRKQQRDYAEKAKSTDATTVDLTKEMLKNLNNRSMVLDIYRQMSPAQRQEVLNLAPGLAQEIGDDRGGIPMRAFNAVTSGISDVAQPIMELAGQVTGTDWGGTPEEIEFIRQLQGVASQEFAPARPGDPWYQKGPLQALQMTPWMATTIGGGIGGGAAAKAGGQVLARGASAGVPGAKAVFQGVGAVGKIPKIVGLKGATTKATMEGLGTVAGITAAGFPSQYAQEVDSLKELGMEDNLTMRLLAGGTAAVASALESVIPNPLKAGPVPLTQGAVKAARQYLWNAAKQAPGEMSEEYLQGVTSGLGQYVAQYLDENAEDKSIADAFQTGYEQAKEAALPMAFLLGVPALGGAANTARLARLQAIRAKGFVSTEDAQKEGIEGKNRKERLANADKQIKQLEQESVPPVSAGHAFPTTPTIPPYAGPPDAGQPNSTPPSVPPRLPGAPGAAQGTPPALPGPSGGQTPGLPAPQTPQVPGKDDLRDVGKAGGAIVDDFYESIRQSLKTTGKVPGPERGSSVGQAWDAWRDKTDIDGFVEYLRKSQGTTSKETQDASQVPTNEGSTQVQGNAGQGSQVDSGSQVRGAGQDQAGAEQKGKEPTAQEVPVEGKPSSSKEPWQMLPDEYATGDADQRAIKLSAHPNRVKKALEEGKSVPVEVLESYKNNKWAKDALAQQPTTPQAPVEPTQVTPKPVVAPEAKVEPSKPQASQEKEPANPEWDVIEAPDGTGKKKLYREDPNPSLTPSQRKATRQEVGPTEVALVTKDFMGKPIPKETMDARKEFVDKAKPGTTFRRPNFNKNALFEVGKDGKISSIESNIKRPSGDVQSLVNTINPGDITEITEPSVGPSEGSAGSPTVIPDAPVTPETRKGKAEGEDQSSEASADKSSARKMEPTEEGRPADGKPVMPGDRFLTNTGRETTPYPKYDGSTERKTQNGEKRSQQWLIENAMAEAESRGDDFNLTTFRSQLEDARKGKLPQASKDSATLYVFGEDVPKVPKPLLKDRSQQPPSIVPDGITDESSESSAAEIDRRMGKQPESKWQSETRAKLESVPALKGAKVETDEKAGTAKVTRPDGLTTTIHFNADEELAKAATEKGRKPESIHGRYVRKPGEKTGSIYLHSSANHSNVLNHEVMHWLEDQGVVTPAEVEQYGGREAIAEKYGKWAELKQRKKDSVFQRIHDTLEPLFSAQRRFFEDVSKRGVASDAQKPQPHKPDLPTIVDKTDAEAGWITLSDVERQEVTPPEQPAIPEFKRTTPDKGSTTRQFQAERVEKAKTEIADLERKRRAKQGEHDGIRKNATKKRAAVRGEIESLNRMIGKIEGEIAADFTSDTIAKLEDELESPRSYDHYLAGMKAIHRLKASAAEDAARRGEMGREAARAEVSKEQREADRFDAELQGRAKELAKSQGFDSGDAEQIALAASNGFTVFEDRSLSDVVEVQGKRTREARVSEEIRKMFSPVYAAEQDLNDEQKEALKKQYQDASLDDKNWLAKRNDVDKAVREAIRQREDSERKEKAAEKAKDEQEALAHARERAKKHFMDERISKALKKRKPKTKPVKIRRESNGGPVKVVNGKTIAGDQKGELYPNGLILHKSFEEDSKDFVLTHARSGSGFPFSAKKSDMKELVGMIDLLGIDFNVDVDENGALPSELTTRMKKVNTAWDNSDYSVLSEEDRATVEALSEVATTDIQADLILTADDIGANGIAPGMEKVMTDRGVRVVKEMSKAVPEFAYDPVFTVQDGLLVYRDGYIFKLQPQVFNLHPSELKEGQTVGINIEDMGIKRATPQDVVAEILKGAGIPRVTKSKSGRDVSAGYVGSMPVSIQQGEADNDWYVVGGNSKVRVIAVDALNKIRWRQPGQSGDPKTDLEVSGKDVDSKAAASEPQDDSSGATGKGSGTANKIEPNVVERSSVAAGTPQQSSRADFSFTEGETPQGKRLLNRMKGDSVKRRIGPRSILNYLKDVVRTGSIEGKSQLSKKNPGHYKPREHLVRSRTGTSGVIDTHEAGHALSALLRDVDPKVLKRHEAGLVALTHLHGSMASAKTAEEGMAEYIRRFITDYQSIPEPLRSNLQADIAFISPELLAGLKDTNRLWQQFLARPLQERLDASKNDRQQRKDGRGFRDAVYRSLYNIIGGDVAIHKVRRELERPLFQFSQALGSTFRELASDTQADVDNAYQSVIRVPVETQRAIFGDSRSKDQGVRIIAFGDNMFSEEDTQFLRDGGFRVPDEFKHGEPVYLTHQSFEQIREKLGDDWDAFENYGQLRASLERAEKKGHESAWMHENVSQAEARQAIADMENANPDWTQRFDEVREFFDGLLLVATLSGEYTPLEAVRIRNAWDSYWPLLRQVTPEESSRVGRGGPDPSAGVHRAFGSALPLRNLLEAVEMRTKAAMQAYYTNRMMLAMRHYSDTLHAMDDAPFDIRKAGARLMVPLKMDLKKVASLSPEEQAQMITKYMNEQLEKEARDRGEEVDPDELLSVEDVAISMPWRPIFRATRPGAIQVIGLTENGQRKYYQVTDPLLFDLFSNSESMSRYGTWLARFFAKGIGPWKRALTQNLAFAVRNVLRDTATALLAGEGAKAFMPGIYLAYGVVGRLNGSLGRDAPAQAELFSRSLEVLHHPRHKKVWDDFKETVTEGLLIPDYWEMNFYDRVSEAPGQLSAGALLPVTIFNWATGGRYISQMSEELQREGAFSEARGRGVSYEYAQRQYDQISGNFSQRQPHHATATFVRSAGFLNPGLQIWWGQVKRWTDPDPRAGKLHRAKLPALAAVYAVSSAINVALVYAMFGDDDDKLEEVLNDMRERPDYEKDTTMSVMGTVRLPFEYGLGGAVSSFAWNATQDSLLGGSNESIPTRLKAFLARAVQVPGPTDAIHPYLKTAMELTMGDVGFSFYRQDSIVPEQLIVQYPVNPELRAYDDTPALFKQIGETARVSPLKVEYAVGSLLTGTASDLIALGGKVAGGETLEAKDFPVLSRLIQRPSTGFRSQAVRELRKSQQEVQAMGVKIQKMGDAASQELLDKYAKLHDASLAYDVVSKMYDEVQEEVDAAETDHTAVDKTERQMTHFARQFLNYQAGKVPAPTQLKEREHEYYGLKAIQATGDPESKTAIATQEKAVAMLKLSGYTYEESAKALIDYWESTNTTKNSRGVEVRGNAKEMKDGRPVLKAAVRTRLVRLRKLYAK